MAPGVRAGAGASLGGQQPHALRGQESGVTGGAGDPPFPLPTAPRDKNPGARDRHGDSARSSSAPTDPSRAQHPVGATRAPPEAAGPAGNLGEQLGGRSPAGERSAPGAAGPGAGPGSGDAPPKEFSS